MKMVTEFVFSHSTWMTNTIDEMLRGTERRKNKNKKGVPGRAVVSKRRPMKRS